MNANAALSGVVMEPAEGIVTIGVVYGNHSGELEPAPTVIGARALSELSVIPLELPPVCASYHA